jgi:tetratricopeptide (TPR) repeat protein
MDLQGASIFLLGRLDRIARRRLVAALATMDARLVRQLSRNTHALAIGHGGVDLLQSGALERAMSQADRLRIPVVSEHALLRRLDLLPALRKEPRPHDHRAFASSAGLDEGSARLIVLFDIIEDDAGSYSFRDLRAVRSLARHMDLRQALPLAIRRALDLRRRHSFRRHLAELPLTVAETAAQIELDLGDPATGFDMLWDLAATAEARQDYVAAEDAYRRCAAMRPRDVDSLFNLACTLLELDRADEARSLLVRAVAIDPDFAEAWFNLSGLEEGATATQCLERAIAADPQYADAIHDLALVYTNADLYDKALPLWERYLSLASTLPAAAVDPEAVGRARRAVMLCRMAKLKSKADGA